MKKILKWGSWILVITFIGAQFYRMDKTNPPVDSARDFITRENPPENIANILKRTCYDCHSNETRYPWYSNITPIWMLLDDHIHHARSHLNFSEWGKLKKGKRGAKIFEVVEMVGEEEMPLWDYALMHSEAQLTKEERDELTSWFESKLD